jgi:hypothetical protein
MAPDRLPVPTRTFLAERYRAGTSPAVARRESEAAQRAAVELSGEGRPVRLIGSLLVASDETVFSLFGASSPEDVAAVGERIDQPFDRISEGVAVLSHRGRRAGNETHR